MEIINEKAKVLIGENDDVSYRDVLAKITKRIRGIDAIFGKLEIPMEYDSVRLPLNSEECLFCDGCGNPIENVAFLVHLDMSQICYVFCEKCDCKIKLGDIKV